MPKFIFISEEINPPSKVTFEVQAQDLTLSDVLHNFEHFLRASGFYLNGYLEVNESTDSEVYTEEDKAFNFSDYGAARPTYFDEMDYNEITLNFGSGDTFTEDSILSIKNNENI